MARDLRLEVHMSAVDRLTAPLRAITRSSSATAQALKANREQLKQLKAQQRDVDSFRQLAAANEETAAALQASRQKLAELGRQTAAVRQQLAPLNALYEESTRRLDAEKASNEASARALKAVRAERTLAREEFKKATASIASYNERLAQGIDLSAEERAELARLIAGQAQRRASIEQLETREKKLAEQHTESSRTLRLVRDGHKAVRQEMQSIKRPHDELLRQYKEAKAATEQLGQQYGKQQHDLQGLQGKLAEAGIKTNRLGAEELRLKQKLNDTNRTIDQQTEALKRATRQQERLAQAKEQYERLQGVAGSMSASGAAGLATGSGILYAGARMIAPGMDFDASMSKVQALSRLGKDSPELQALREQARQLGASTQFTAVQAADAQSFLAMAGFDPKAIMAAMPSMLDMAMAGDLDLSRAADISSNILSAFGIDPAESGRVADVLTKTFTTSNVNLEMLGQTMKYVGPVARQAGMSLEETAAMAGLLGNIGIQSDTAGTTLRSMLTRLASPSGSAAKALKKLGIEALDAQGNVRNMPELLTEVAKATEKMGSGERLGFIKTVFGEEPAAGISELIEKSGAAGVAKYLEVVNDSAGAAAQTARIMGDNLRGDLNAMGSAWQDLGIQIQDAHNGPLRDITQGITRLIGSIKAWMIENPKLAAGIAKAVIGFGMLAAAMGSIALVLASILAPFALVRFGLMMLGIRLPSVIGLFKTFGVGLFAAWKSAGGLAGIVLRLGVALQMAGGPLGVVRMALGGLLQMMGGLARMMTVLIRTNPMAALVIGIGAAVMHLVGRIDQIKALFQAGDWGALGMEIVNGIVAGLNAATLGMLGVVADIAMKAWETFAGVLGIRSPSRVFAEMGGDIMSGLDQGLSTSQDGPLKTVAQTAKQLTAAGTVALGASMAMPAAADLPGFDTRPPLAAAGAPSAAAVAAAPANITINITAAPGMDEAALARLVAQEVQRITSSQAARSRSALHDRE